MQDPNKFNPEVFFFNLMKSVLPLRAQNKNFSKKIINARFFFVV